MAPPEQSNGHTPPLGPKAQTAGGLLITNAGKLLGLFLIYQEWQGQARVPVMVVCLSLVFGAQSVENMLLRAIDRVFSRE